jgi:RIO-like serine/threonine protein kinase
MTTRDLKHDALGTIRLIDAGGTPLVERDTRTARFGVRWLARRLAAREARTLARLGGFPGVPRLLAFDGTVLRRSYLPGAPLYAAAPTPTPRYFARALRLLRALHRSGIVHNDLAKEANWLCAAGDDVGIVDFQVALCSRRRGLWFRALAFDDLRHLLKHKRTYQPERLTQRQRALLATPALPSKLWRRLWKPLYRGFTRGVLGWRDREGPIERHI